MYYVVRESGHELRGRRLCRCPPFGPDWRSGIKSDPSSSLHRCAAAHASFQSTPVARRHSTPRPNFRHANGSHKARRDPRPECRETATWHVRARSHVCVLKSSTVSAWKQHRTPPAHGNKSAWRVPYGGGLLCQGLSLLFPSVWQAGRHLVDGEPERICCWQHRCALISFCRPQHAGALRNVRDVCSP